MLGGDAAWDGGVAAPLRNDHGFRLRLDVGNQSENSVAGVAIQKPRSAGGVPGIQTAQWMFVKSFKIFASMSRGTREGGVFVLNDGPLSASEGGDVFEGPSTSSKPDEMKLAWFREPVAARFFEVIPHEWNHRPIMRVGLLMVNSRPSPPSPPPPPPYAQWEAGLSRDKCDAMLRDPTHLFRYVGWYERRRVYRRHGAIALTTQA